MEVMNGAFMVVFFGWLAREGTLFQIAGSVPFKFSMTYEDIPI
jgi:hypothetical protein